ncbi:MAG: L,D-transpeptidase [Ilumatobacter sp.]
MSSRRSPLRTRRLFDDAAGLHLQPGHRTRVTAAGVAATALILGACSTGSTTNQTAVPIPGAPIAANQVVADDDATADDSTADDSTANDSTANDSATTTSLPSVSAPPTTQDAAETTSTTIADAGTTTTSTTTTSTTTTTTTTTIPALDVYDPECVVEVESGDSLGLIVDRFDDETINIATVRSENSIDGTTIDPGQLLDICVDNGLDDVTGAERERNQAIVEAETLAAVTAQQIKLNELLTGYGMRELLVDGISGPVTRRHLCAARLGLGLDVTLTDMEPGSDEEAALFAADNIVAPFTSALNQDRWILIDRTCQVMFVGEGATTLNFVFPTSTGSQGFETRDQDQSRVFRYDPALENDGWHNSSDYPVPIDNPLNGNMYRPLYFDGGQAIHGANNVPTTPQSKGCARLSPSNQNALVNWLGLQGANGPQGRVGVTVNVQGAYPHAAAPDAVTEANATVDT